MSPEELDEARANEAARLWELHPTAVPRASIIAARLAREGWKPPEPGVDPDVLAFREWVRGEYPDAHHVDWDVVAWERSIFSKAFLAGVRYAREDAAQRAKEALAAKVAAADVMRQALAERGEKP